MPKARAAVVRKKARHPDRGGTAAGDAATEGVALVREALLRSKGVLSLADKVILARIEKSGPWRTLADLLADQARSKSNLVEQLTDADDLLQREAGASHVACWYALRALSSFAGVSSAAIDHLGGTILKTKAIEDRQRFEGRLSALIDILEQTGLRADGIYEGTDSYARKLRKLAEGFAQSNGYQWARDRNRGMTPGAGKMRRVHREVRGKVNWAASLGELGGAPSEAKPLRPLTGAQLGELPIARLEFADVWTRARQSGLSGNKLRQWVVDRAELYFSQEATKRDAAFWRLHKF